MIKTKPRASVIVINYNNFKYLNRCLNSLIQQKYKNFEIVLVDDNSTDNSLELAKNFFKKQKFKKNKIIVNKKKTKFGSYNQMNCIMKGLNYCRGDLIFFLDSDDFFKRSKLENVINFFNKNTQLKITFDLSYKFFSSQKKKKFKINKRFKNLIPWPSFPSQSSIVIEKKYLKKIIANLSIKKYPNIWFDFRVITKSYHDFGKIRYLNKYLTYYQQHPAGVSSKFKKFSKNWWQRRKEAHEFIKKEIYKNKKKIFSLDYYLTNLVNIFL